MMRIRYFYVQNNSGQGDVSDVNKNYREQTLHKPSPWNRINKAIFGNTHMYVYLSIYLSICVYIYICMYIYTYVYILYLYIHIYVSSFSYVNMFVSYLVTLTRETKRFSHVKSSDVVVVIR